MVQTDKIAGVEHIACELCLKEVPRSEATVAEAVDYVAHFCGLDCYEKWKKQTGALDQPAEPSSA